MSLLRKKPTCWVCTQLRINKSFKQLLCDAILSQTKLMEVTTILSCWILRFNFGFSMCCLLFWNILTLTFMSNDGILCSLLAYLLLIANYITEYNIPSASPFRWRSLPDELFWLIPSIILRSMNLENQLTWMIPAVECGFDNLKKVAMTDTAELFWWSHRQTAQWLGDRSCGLEGAEELSWRKPRRCYQNADRSSFNFLFVEAFLVDCSFFSRTDHWTPVFPCKYFSASLKL